MPKMQICPNCGQDMSTQAAVIKLAKLGKTPIEIYNELRPKGFFANYKSFGGISSSIYVYISRAKARGEL